jgi:hypothetical protein
MISDPRQIERILCEFKDKMVGLPRQRNVDSGTRLLYSTNLPIDK